MREGAVAKKYSEDNWNNSSVEETDKKLDKDKKLSSVVDFSPEAVAKRKAEAAAKVQAKINVEDEEKWNSLHEAAKKRVAAEEAEQAYAVVDQLAAEEDKENRDKSTKLRITEARAKIASNQKVKEEVGQKVADRNVATEERMDQVWEEKEWDAKIKEAHERNRWDSMREAVLSINNKIKNKLKEKLSGLRKNKETK